MTISLKAALVERAKKVGRERGQRLADSSDGWALRNLSWKERRAGSELEYALAEIRKLRGAPSDSAAQEALAQILEDASEERYEEIRRLPIGQRVHEHLERTRGPFNQTPIWLIVSDGRCDTSHGYSTASADEAVGLWRKATGSAADAKAIPKEGRFALVQERGGMYSPANTKLKLDVAVQLYWADNKRHPAMYVLATGANGPSAGGTGLVWETTFRPVEPDWFILTVHQDIATDLGEGPFDSEEQAREFAEAEVGATWVLFRAPPGTVPAFEAERDGGMAEKRLRHSPKDGNLFVLKVDEQQRVASVSKAAGTRSPKDRTDSGVFFRAPPGTRDAFERILRDKGHGARAAGDTVGRHELPDGHEIRVGPGTVQVRARTGTGWEWFDVASNAEACDALSVYALNADLVAPATYELPDGHDIQCGPGFKVQVREITGKWLDIATTDEACAVLAALAREAAKLDTSAERKGTRRARQPAAGGADELLHKLIASAAAHGRESDSEHEIGDLDLFIRTVWERLTSAQQRAFYDRHVPKGSAANRAKGDRIWKLLLHAEDRRQAREVANLQRILTAAWALLTPEQQQSAYDKHAEDVDFWLSGEAG